MVLPTGNNRTALALIAVLCMCGMSVSAVGTYNTLLSHVTALFNPILCGNTNCADVYASALAMPLGIPLAWIGFLFYLWLAIMATWSIWNSLAVQAFVRVGLVLALSSIVFSMGLATILVFHVHALCLSCVSMYLVNFLLCLTFGRISGCSTKDLLLRTLISRKEWILSKPGVVVSFLISFVAFIAVGGAVAGVITHSWREDFQVDARREVRHHFQQSRRELMVDPNIPVRGNPYGSIVVVLFSDFQCPFCAGASLVLQRFARNSDEIQLRFVQFPLDKSINPYTPHGNHDMAGLLARAALCAHKRSSFWRIHDDFFANQEKVDHQYLSDLIAQCGWDRNSFDSCMQSSDTEAEIRKQIEMGRAVGVDGTPSVFINGRLVRRWDNEEVLRGILKNELTNGRGDRLR